MDSSALWLVSIPVLAVLWVVLWAVMRRGLAVPDWRSIPAFEVIRRLASEAPEEGRPVHVSLGMAGISDVNAMETVASLNVLDHLARQPAVTLAMPVVTTGNAASLLVAQDVMSRPYVERDHVAQFDPLNARFIGGGATDAGAAYQAGVLDLLDRRTVGASLMLGHFGDEVLLAGEAAVRNGIPQVAGSGNLAALPSMALSTDKLLICEDLFAAGAYLSRDTALQAALVAQDVARWLAAAGIIALVVLRTLGRL